MDSLDFAWVQRNLNKFQNNVSWQPDEIKILFEIYSKVDKKTHRPTGCSRCVASARARVYVEYQNELKKRFDQ